MWAIVYDLTENKAVDVRSMDYDARRALDHKFRLLDDDGEVYYRGYSDDSESEEAFAPLDDYGAPNAGCVHIQYLRDGKWETL